MLQTEIVEDLAAFDRLAAWWNDQPGPKNSVFLRTEWFKTIAAARLGRQEQLKVWVVTEDDSPVAAIPTYQTGARIRSLTETATESFDMIYNGHEAAVRHLLADLMRCTEVRFEALSADSPLLEVVRRYPGWLEDHRTQVAEIDLSNGLDQVLNGMGKSMRSNLRKAERSLVEMGELTMVGHPGPVRLKQLLGEGLALEARGWKGEFGHAVMSAPQRLGFFTDLAEVAAENDWLRLRALYLDGRMIAFNYDLEYAGRMVGLLTAYDESLPRRCSPGNLLLLKTLEQAAHRGVTTYDLGSVGGRKSGKLEWSSSTTPRFYVTGFGPGLRGRAARSLWQVKDTVRRARRG